MAHTGVGHGAIRPSGRVIYPTSITDVCSVTTTYGTTETLGIIDIGTVVQNALAIEKVLIGDNSEIIVNAQTTDVVTESVFGAVVPIATTSEQLVISDNSQIVFNAQTTDVVTESVFGAPTQNNVAESIPISDSGVKD